MKARERMRSYEKRDEDKIKTDRTKNDFESVIYAMRGWLNEEENNPYIVDKDQDALLSKLVSEEEWLLDGEGEYADYIEYTKRFMDLDAEFQKLKTRKSDHSTRDEKVALARQRLDTVEEKVNELEKKKPHVTKE